MDVNAEKFKAYYADLLAKKEEAVAVALADLDAKVNEAFELAKAEIAEKVKADLIAEAEAPFKHDIELCEKFFVEEAVEEVADENVAVEGEF